MTKPAEIHGLPARLACDRTPEQALAGWPRSTPLAVLWSGTPADPGHRRWSRWTILARPTEVIRIAREEPDPLGRLHDLLATEPRRRPLQRSDHDPPFIGGWIVALSYELGRVIEPATGPRLAGSDGRPLITLLRCPDAYVHDGAQNAWWSVGTPAAVMEPPAVGAPPGFHLGTIRRTRGAAYEDAVARAVEYTHAGDIFQANISHRLSAEFRGSSRAFFGALCGRASPWYGAYFEDRDSDGRVRAIASASPELFLEFDARTRTVVTRPIKGTRRAGADVLDLESSPKDRAELNMIVDLMRNDLGRVCEYGSVRVAQPRAIEHHAVQHGVATVQGRLRASLSIIDLLRATFPGGSVTGAPKIRAMQIIDELEGEPRGIYTGAIGFISDCGNARFNIAIRTACVEGRVAPGAALDEFADAELSYRAGAGIVAESVPALEWRETLDKATILLDLARPRPTVRRRRARGALA